MQRSVHVLLLLSCGFIYIHGEHCCLHGHSCRPAFDLFNSVILILWSWETQWSCLAYTLYILQFYWPACCTM